MQPKSRSYRSQNEPTQTVKLDKCIKDELIESASSSFFAILDSITAQLKKIGLYDFTKENDKLKSRDEVSKKV